MIQAEAEPLMNVILERMREKGIPTDRIPDPVPFEVYGTTLHLRPLTAASMAQLYQWIKADESRYQIANAALFVQSACDERGRLLLNLDDVPDVVNGFDWRIVEAVAMRVGQINKFGQNDE